MQEMDSVAGYSLSYLFVFHPKDQRDFAELKYLMKRDNFSYPVWIDLEDSFNKMSKLPMESAFHTLLVDKQNKVAAIGDPFQNARIKELYLNMFSGNLKQDQSEAHLTEIAADQSIVDLGEFDWKTPKEAIFRLKNTGKNKLVVNDVVASCGCISVDFPKTPINSGENAIITVTYKADKPEFFSKALIVYANTKTPLKLTVKGSAN